MKAIAVGSVASGIGLVIDAWFLLVYCNATPAKFQVSPVCYSVLWKLTVSWAIPENGRRRLRQIPVLLYFSTDTGALHVYIRFRAHDVPVVGGVVRVAYCGAGHVIHGWCAGQPPVHRVWRALCCGFHRGSDTEYSEGLLAMRCVDTSAAL